MGCRSHFGPQAEFSGWKTGCIINECRCYNTGTNGVMAQKPGQGRGAGVAIFVVDSRGRRESYPTSYCSRTSLLSISLSD